MAKKKKENLVDTVVVVTELQKKFLKNFVSDRMSAEMAFEKASDNMRYAARSLWKTIFDFYPELEDYHSTYNSEAGEISVIGKK